MSVEVPQQTVCANRDCGHPLSKHRQHDDEVERGSITVEDIKSYNHVCLWTDKQTGMFTVCACRDFELPERNQPPTEVPPSPLPVPGQDVVEWPLGPGTKLQLHPDGRVTWFAG